MEKYKWTADEHDVYIRSKLAQDAEQINRDADIEEATNKGRAQGKAEGIAQGLAEGLAKGEAEERTKIALNLLSQNVNIATIIKATGLSKETIEKLKELKI